MYPPPPAVVHPPVHQNHNGGGYHGPYDNQHQPLPLPPPVVQLVAPPIEPWSSGLCDCHQDCSNCCLTMWCPCIVFGRIAEILDAGSIPCCVSGTLHLMLCCVGFPCLYTCFYRTKIRQQYLLQEEPCNDCMVECLCSPCSLCQQHRELQNRGLEVSIGWQGNLERQIRISTRMQHPTIMAGMMRSR